MRAFTQSTPCPAVVPSARGRRVSFAQDTQPLTNIADSTEDVDFTTELRAQIRNAKPRRRASVAARGRSAHPSRDVWQDVGLDERQQEAAVPNEGRARAKRMSILERPAMRAPVLARKVVEATEPRTEPMSHSRSMAHETSLSRPRRISGIVNNFPQAYKTSSTMDMMASRRTSMIGGVHLPVLDEQRRPHPLAQSMRPSKEARRRTMYVPSDDTTIVTIHPGASQQVPDDTWRRSKPYDIGLDLVTVSEEESENTSAAPLSKRRPRMSLAAKPRRAPLQQSNLHTLNAVLSEDIVGEGGGKENVPPGMEKVVKLDVKAGPTDIVIHFDDATSGKNDTFGFRRQSMQAPTITRPGLQSGSKHSTHKENIKVGMKRTGSSSLAETLPAKAARSQHPNGGPTRPTPNTRTWTVSAADWHRDSRYNQPDTTMSSVTVHGNLQSRSRLPKHRYQAPIIAEDLEHPELYEEQWLYHQEVATTQILDQLLTRSQQTTTASPRNAASRRQMLRLYQDDETLALLERLQASLRYGAMSIPANLLPKVSRLRTDIGFRRDFMNLWLDTYDHDALKLALEVVVGREVVLPKRLSGLTQTGTEDEIRERLLRKGIERYLQAFVISNEDVATPKPSSASIGSIARHVDSCRSEEGSSAWSWRRTLSKSLMLIRLLDQAKSTKLLDSCLFSKSSMHKSSVSVLRALGVMLSPSVGDISRPLGQLNYRVQVVQYPLEEYDYRIDNLAVDLRDGIILTRVVELLDLKPTIPSSGSDATMTIALPTGEILESLLDTRPSNKWPLSQHLKLPCIGRAQKLYNVQIALSALAGLGGAASRTVSMTTADDIVDGHREKTVSLLWALVSQAGAGLLVNDTDLEREIRRLNAHHAQPCTDETDSVDFEHQVLGSVRDEDTQTRLLQSWAAAVGRRHGISVTNLTTSFANGRAIEAIVNEYGQITSKSASTGPSIAATGHTSLSQQTLSAKLRSVGCSGSFVALFAPDKSGCMSQPFSRSFTLLTLSYLASRLLPLTVTHRAALVLQRAWRKFSVRSNIGRRLRLVRLAHDCATVVKTRNVVIGAATVIQRAWKKVLDRRLQSLNVDISVLQTQVRGWALRRRLQSQVTHGASLTTRGGW